MRRPRRGRRPASGSVKIRPLLLLSYFAPGALPRLLQAARAVRLPRRTRVYVGSYGVGAELSAQVHAAGYRYAPMFQLQPGWYWERRRLSRRDERKLLAVSSGAGRLAGPLPELQQLLRLTPTARVAWGVELGRRFRDELRAAMRAGVAVSGWQLDEIQAEAAGAQGRAHRDLTRGAVRGLLLGRPALGDRSQQGFVWWAHTAFTLPRRAITPELEAFWRLLQRACLGFVGEEYPDFFGDPVAVARAQAAGQRGLRAGGPVRRALARKYVVGLTPGYRRAPGLGGNTHGLSREAVNRWRTAYVRARAATAPAGFAEFNFRYENNRVRVMRDVLGTLADALG